MSNSQQRPWSDDLNAPKIPYDLYFEEKGNLAGIFIGSILYGMRETPPASIIYSRSLRMWGSF